MQFTTSSSSAFLSKVHPKISIIEVGAGNSYDHSTSATLGRLAQVGSAVYRYLPEWRYNGDNRWLNAGSQPIAGIAKTVTTQQALRWMFGDSLGF